MQEMKNMSSSGNDSPSQGVPPKPEGQPDIAPSVPSIPTPSEDHPNMTQSVPPVSSSESDESGQTEEPEQEADNFFTEQTKRPRVDKLLRRLSDK